MEQVNNSNKIFEKIANEDQFDLLRLFQIILKKPKILFVTTFTSLISAIFYAYLQKPTWQGDFQIVLESDNPEQSFAAAAPSGLSALIPIAKGPSKILTEVEILESPSVLKPVFDFVKSEKNSKGINTSNYRFKKWKSRLNIELLDETSVLNITYKDDDKNLIKKVIEKISKEYQDYSGIKREKRLNDGIFFLENQIIAYKKKSLESSEKLQEFSQENNLSYVSNTTEAGDKITVVDVEKLRIEAVSKINSLEMQISQLKKFDENNDNFKFYVDLIPQLSELEVNLKINELDSELNRLKLIYKNNDPIVKNLLSEKEILTKSLKDQAYGLLNAELINAKNQLEVSTRPEGIIVLYRELIRDNQRNQTTLFQLETNLQKLILEVARNQDPWKLISNPTVLDKPVAPIKRQIALYGMIGGLFLGSLLSLLKYKKDKLLFYSDEYQKILNLKLLLNLPLLNQDLWESQIKALINGLKMSINMSSLYFIYPDKNIPDKVIDFIRLLRNSDIELDINLNPDISSLSNDDNILMLAYPGGISSDKLNLKMQELRISKKNVIGWIYFSDDKFKL